MIVLDANVLIGFLDARDAHHPDAIALLDEHIAEGYAASVLTVAEVLVHPVSAQRQDQAVAALRGIQLVTTPLTENDALSLARVRAEYRMRMPDAVVLHTALSVGTALATFDASLAHAARQAGITVLGTSDPPE